jgi:tetratricopeptide (TPR) repeat protein
MKLVFACGATAFVAIFAFLRAADVFKVHEIAVSEFGTGVSPWYPERAVEFIERGNVPGEIWNSYVDGGFVTWRLGPQRRDYIDGRAIPFGPKSFLLQAQLEQYSPDSQQWLAEADRYNINTILLPVSRFETVLGQLKNFCNSANWQPVYLDEVAAVFIRRKPENENLIKRSQIDCSTAPLPSQPVAGSTSSRFAQWANAAAVLAAVGRNSEALAAADQAGAVYPDSSYVPWLRGNVFYTMGLRTDAEREYLKAISADPKLPLFWFSLAAVYKHEGRIPETIEAQRRGIRLSTMAQPFELLKLARLYLDIQQPRAALETFNEAVRAASPDILARSRANRFKFEADQGRAAAWRALGDTKRAAEFDQEAVQDVVPDGQESR